jgi:hypothetical protein
MKEELKKGASAVIKVGMLVCFVVVLVLSGCASMFGGGGNELEIYSEQSGARVVVFDRSGNVIKESITPATIVMKGKSPFKIEVSKDGYLPKTVEVKKGFNHNYWWNIPGTLIGVGVIGLVLDPIIGSTTKITPRKVNAILQSPEELAKIEARKQEQALEAERRANLVVTNSGILSSFYPPDEYFPYDPYSFAIGNWGKYFSTRGTAEQWLKDIAERAKAVDDVVYARVELYNSDVRAFKTFPSKIMRDAVLKDKDNVIEAYNRYKPINADIAKVLAKGVVFEGNKQPGRNVADVAEKIDAYNKEYARLIDTYPVD